MSHDHHHPHPHTPEAVNRAFIAGILLNLAFVIIEAGFGFFTPSLALLTDAGHNLGDVAGLAIALLAFRLAKIKASPDYTYGYQKTTILAALANAVILFIAIGGIGWEATQRLLHPRVVEGNIVAAVAAIGIVINSVTALLFFHNRKMDLNVKGAYLHLAADAAVSVGVVISGIIMYYTNWFWLDSAISFAIMIVIFISTWKLLKDTVRLSLDGVPHNVNLDEIKKAAAKIVGVKDLHHIHIWAMSTTTNALTAHMVVDETNSLADVEKTKHDLKHALQNLNIQHVTLEIELQNKACEEDTCE